MEKDSVGGGISIWVRFEIWQGSFGEGLRWGYVFV